MAPMRGRTRDTDRPRRADLLVVAEPSRRCRQRNHHDGSGAQGPESAFRSGGSGQSQRRDRPVRGTPRHDRRQRPSANGREHRQLHPQQDPRLNIPRCHPASTVGPMKYLDVDGVGQVSRIGLGTWQFGSREWGYGDDYASGIARDIVKRALASGVTLFDTAEIYGLGKSERILGEALGDARAEVAVASKIMPIAPFPAVVKQRERASARRLQLDRIPLYQIHQPNPVFPDSVIMPGMRSLLDSGDIGAAGVSNYSLDRWQRADAALGRPVISNQVHFSLAHPGALDDLVPFAERENRVVFAYSPLAQGLLGGKYGVDNRPGGVRAVNSLFGTENLRRIEPLLQTLRDVATEVGAKPAQVALAWLISLPGVVAIPGASSVEQLEFNVAAADIELSAASRDALTEAARAFRPTSAGRFLTDMAREKLGRH